MNAKVKMMAGTFPRKKPARTPINRENRKEPIRAVDLELRNRI